MIESIISYIIKTLLIYYFYVYYGLVENCKLCLLIIEVVAIWWLYDVAINPLIFGSEHSSEFFSKIFSVDILNICISVYYLIGGIIMYILWTYWADLKTTFAKMGTLFLFFVIYNRVYYSILDMTNKELKEGFCGCGLA